MADKKVKVICVCCDYTGELNAPNPEHLAETVHRCPECNCVLLQKTETTEHWHV